MVLLEVKSPREGLSVEAVVEDDIRDGGREGCSCGAVEDSVDLELSDVALGSGVMSEPDVTITHGAWGDFEEIPPAVDGLVDSSNAVPVVHVVGPFYG